MHSIHKREIILASLSDWFEEGKRNFPWRKNPTPYVVWVSEVMLQQTRASVVVPYFERWMRRYPTILSLAKSSEEEVIKMWEGLGYYSRARALYEGAKYVSTHYEGKLPKDPDLLKKIKGIGPYTVGAILNFAFHQKIAAIDGNVLRVISRLYCYEKDIHLPQSQKYMKQRVEELLPDEKPWVIMEALIELGATVCRPHPLCELCPIQEGCLAYQKGKEKILPIKKKRKETLHIHRIVSIICYDNQVLLQKQEGKKIMSGLYEFPYFEEEAYVSAFYLGKLEKKRKLTQVKHAFTHHIAHLTPILWLAKEKKDIQGFIWVSFEAMKKLPFSSGHRKIFKEIEHADFAYREL